MEQIRSSCSLLYCTVHFAQPRRSNFLSYLAHLDDSQTEWDALSHDTYYSISLGPKKGCCPPDATVQYVMWHTNNLRMWLSCSCTVPYSMLRPWRTTYMHPVQYVQLWRAKTPRERRRTVVQRPQQVYPLRFCSAL